MRFSRRGTGTVNDARANTSTHARARLFSISPLRRFGPLALAALLFASQVNAQIVHQGTFTATSGGAPGASITVNNVTAGTNQLYLISVALYGTNMTVSSVTNTGGLTFTLKRSQCSARISQPQVEIWQAFGTPSGTFSVTANISGTADVVSAAVSRYSGVDSTTPTEGVNGSNSNGLNGACTGGVDNTTQTLSLTSTLNSSVHYVATHTRNRQLSTQDSEYSQRAFINNSNSGMGAVLYVHEKLKTTAGADSADHSTGANAVDWDMAGLVIRPAQAGSCPMTVPISASSDDAEEPAAGGTVDLTSSDLELINDGADQQVGMRFANLNIPQGATITNAYVTFRAKDPGSVATNLTFYAENIDSAPTFANTPSSQKVTTRTKTSASVAWSSVPAWNTVDQAHDSPELKTIIQEVVNRPGWAANNSLAIIVTGTAGSLRRAWSFDGAGVEPSLHVQCVGGAAPAVTSAVAEISPNNVTTSSTGNAFSYDIQATISGSATGVNRVAITVPGTFGAPTITGVQVNGGGVAYSNNTSGNNISVDLTTKVTASSKITVLFTANAPTSQDLTGVNFTSTVDDSGTATAAQATTQGNGDGDAGDANSWKVTTTNPPGGPPGVCPAPNLGGWYPGGWLYRKPLSIGAANIGSDLTNFPVLVSIASDTDLAADAQGDFDDILFTAADGTTKLSHEIEKFNETTGELRAWVKLPTVSSSVDTIFYLYYGNASATNQQDPSGVWSNGYVGVWHLKEDPSGTAPQMKDSTSNAIHATSVGGMTSGNQVGGQIAGALDLDGTDDYLQSSDYDILSAITVSAWINVDAVSGNQGIVSKRIDNENNGNWVFRLDNNLLQWLLWSGIDASQQLYSVSTVNTGQWKYVVSTFDDPTNTARIYMDGTVNNSTTTMTNVLANTPELILIGQHGQGSVTLNGRMDEVRLSNVARSANWISAEYINQAYHANFQSLCGEENAPSNPAVTSAVAEISPNDVTTSSTGNAFSYDIQATISGSATGVNRVAITVPGTFGAPTITGVQVNGGGVAYSNNTSGNNISVDLTTKVTASSKITVLFTANAPTSQDLTGVNFTSTVDDSGTATAAQATTQGNGDGDAGDANSWKVTTTNGPFSCPIGSEIFSDGFELNNFNAWSGTSVGNAGDSITVSSAQARSGTYSAKGTSDTVYPAQAMVWKDINGQTTIHTKLEIFVPSSFSTTGDVVIQQFLNGWSNIISTAIASDMTLFMWNALGEAYGNSAPMSKNAWHTIEMRVTISPTAGEARLWLDGNLAITATGKNIGSSPVDKVAATFYWATPGTIANTVHMDDAVICGTPPAGGSPGNPVVNSTGNASDATPGDGACNTGGTNSQGATECTLRAAIQEANAYAGADAIDFNIPTSDSGYAASPLAYTINPGTGLPTISEAVVIDATSQPGFPGTPIIVLDSNDAGSNGFALGAGADGTTIRGFVIRDFSNDGILIQAGSDGNTIAGNYIGRLNVSGTDAGAGQGNAARGIEVLGNSNTIGGTTAADRNVISGNAAEGIIISSGASGTIVRGNFIGVAANGTTALGNDQEGIQILGGAPGSIIGGSAAGAGNVIGANGITSGAAISIESNGADNTVVQGNFIGTDLGGTVDLGNIRSGVEVRGDGIAANSPMNTLIGGTNAGQGNVIRFNDLDGVRLRNVPVDVHILGNSISNNGQIGIDLWPADTNDDVTENDAGDGDSGSNDLLNFPEITAAVNNSGTVNVNFNLDVPAGNYRIEFFKNPSGADASGNGEGEVFVSAVTKSHTGSGVESFSHSFAGATGDIITATATRELAGPVYQSTSEFSDAFTVTLPGSLIGHYQFSEGTGQTTADSSASANNATLGPTSGADSGDPNWACLAGGYAIDFDGTDDEVKLGSVAIGNRSAWSISAWIKMGADSGDKRTIYGEGNTVDRQYLFLYVDQPGSHIEFYSEGSGATNPVFMSGATNVETDTWKLVTVVQRTKTDRELYVGTNSEATSSANSGTLNFDSASIGYLRTNAVSDPFKGLIDNVRIYDYALSTAEIAALAASPPGAPCAAVTSAVAEISPNNVATSSTGNAFSYDIYATIGAGDSGVDKITITVPNSFSNVSVSGVQVNTVGVGYTNGSSGNTISVTLNTKVTTSARFTILFTANAPTSADATGVNFTSTVDDSLSGVAAQSTTEGNGDQDGGDLNSWKVTTTDPTGNLIAHWALNEGSGQTAADSSASANNGTLGSTAGSDAADPTWACLASGTALNFDGSNDEVKLGTTTINNRAAWTLSAWIKMSADTADQRTIYSEGDTAQTEYLFLYVDDTTNHAKFFSSDYPGTNYALMEGTTNVENDQWHLITVVQRSKTDRELYVDGISEDTDINNAGTYSFNTSSIGFLRTDWAVDPFKGLIDDVRIYDYALSTAEITALAASPPATPCAPAVTSAVAEISPNDVATNSTGNAFSYDIQATISGSATGVNRVAITVPGTFGAPTVTGVQVNGVGVAYTNNTSGNNISVDLTTKVTASSKITVLFTANAPTSANPTGVNFTSTVDDSTTGDAAQATTEGNGDSNAGDANSWKVTTTTGACPVGNTIFSNGFETGDLSLWTTSSTGTGDTIAASTLQARTGTYSARAQVNNVSTARARVEKTFAGQTTISGRAYFYLDPAWTATGNVELLYLLAPGPTQVLNALVKSDMSLTMWNDVANEGYATTTTISKGAWHSLEIQAVINGANSQARMWLNDTLIMEKVGINLGAAAITQLNAGYHWAFVQTEPNTLYIDDAVLCSVPIGNIVPAVSSAVAEVSPNDVTTSSTSNAFSYDIQATIGGGNSGVNRVAITVPGTFGAPTVTGVQVNGVGVAYTNNTAGNNISVDLTSKVTASSKITVLFTANAPTTQDTVGVNFLSTVDDSATVEVAQSTTQGNGDGDAGDLNSWKVTTTDAPLGSLIGHWTLNEGSGQTAADSAGTNNGTLGSTAGADANDPSWTCVAGGYALDFGGTNEYVDIPPIGDGYAAITVSAWINARSFSASNYNPIVAREETGGTGPPDVFALMARDANVANQASFRVYLGPGPTKVDAGSNTILATDTWYHLAGTYDGATVRFYLDGIAKGSTAQDGTLSSAATKITLGNFSNPSSSYDFDGVIEDVRIYDYALSAGEIAALAATPPTNCGTKVLVITDNKVTPGASDLALQVYLEGRGLTVFYADDDDAEYNTAITANNIDVVYISGSAMSSKIEAADVGYLTVGVVNGNFDNNDDLCLGGGDFSTDPGTTVNLTDNSHFITSPYSTGTFTAYSAGARLIWGGSYGAGAQILAQNPSNASQGAIVAFETGTMLHNCPSTPISAPARRVGTYADGDFSVWTATTKDIVYRSLIWGALGGVVSDPAVTSAVAEISPNDVFTSSTGNAFTYDIQATIGGSDTGVNRVAITVPVGFSNVAVTAVQVDGSPVTYNNNTIGNAISVSLTTKVTSSSRITVLFTADAPTSQDLIGKDFLSTVDDSGTGVAAQSTTEGNGDGNAGDLNSWTVTTTNPPLAVTSAVAEISPNNVVTSSTGNSFSYDISVTISGSATGVNRVAITVPGTFTVNANPVSDVKVNNVSVGFSDVSSGNNIIVTLNTKVTASGKITVLFTADAPTTQDTTGVDFLSTVDDAASAASAQSTTQGNGDGDALDNNSWRVTTTNPAGFSCPIGSSLFSDGFEAGNFSNWDGTSTGTAGDSITVSSVQAKTGSYSAKGVSDAIYPAQANTWKTVTGQTTIHAKAEIYLPSGFSGGTDVVALRFGNGWTNIVTATVNNDRTMFIWNDVVSEAYGYGATSTVSTDAWHTIELQAVVSDTAGEARLWIDGNLEITATGKNLGTSNADRLDTPFYWGTPGTAADTIYVDDVVICGTPSSQAVSSAVAEISPNNVTTSSIGNAFSYDIQATIGGGDTGVDRVAITVPGNFSNVSVSDVKVNGVSVAFTNNTVGNALSVDLTTKVTATSRITVLFSADAPTSQDLTGSNFLSTVDDSATGAAAQATTEGNGDGDAGDANSWTVTTTDAASGACVAYDAASTVSIPSTSPNPMTFSHTTSGSDRLLLVSVASRPNGDDGIFEAVTGITYGGQGLTPVGTAAQGPDNARIEIWRLVNPPTGPNTVSITFNDPFNDPVNGEGASAGAVSFTGVHQTTPLGTFASAIANGTVADTPSVTVSSAIGELVFDTVARKFNPLTVDPSQTQRWNLCTNGSCSSVGGAASTEPGAASVTMSWSPDNTRWAIGAVPIKPSGNCNAAVTSAVAEISPNNVITSSVGNAFSYDIQATITGADTGVNVVAITVPASFGVPTVTDVLVDGLSVPYTDNTSGSAISVVLASKLTTSGKITVLFSADAPTTQNLTGVDFVSTVDDNSTSDPAQATTEGNGDGDAGDANSWTVTTTDGGGGGANPVVNSTGNASDNNAGDGICNTGGVNSQSAVECTLRAAIQEANAFVGLDTITFNMPTSEPGYSGAPLSYTITPSSALPAISEQLVIDATSQPGFSGTPIVVLDGNNVAGDGLTLGATGDGSIIRGFVIRDFGNDGILIQAGSDGSTIAGNYIGRLNISGSDAGVGEDNAARGIEILGANNTIGGTTAADRNVISGNGGEGIIIRSGASSNIVRGNYIGTAADGITALGNGQEGIQIDTGSPGTIIGGPASGAGNVIGANGISSGAAISIGDDGSDNTVVQGNFIGTDASGTVDLGNIRSGVEVRGTGSAATSPLNTLIGGTAAGEGNLIRYNDLDGVRVRDVAVDVAILGNSIVNSGQQGIDLWAAGTNDNVTANDAGDDDSGSNYLMNFPVITSAIANAGNVDINFGLDVPAGNYRVEFFKNPSGTDASGNGEGESYVGYVNITHGGTGVEPFAASISGVVGDILSATATEEISGPTFRNTSEFAANYVVTAGAAVTAAVAEISPNNVVTSGGTYLFQYDIAATITPANTGVDRVAITVPNTFGVGGLPVINVLVNGVAVAFTDNTVGNAISIDLSAKVTTSSRITIVFDAFAPNAEDLAGVDFLSTVDDSTTGDAPQNTTEGNGDGDTEDANSWTVTTTGGTGGGGSCTLAVDGSVSTTVSTSSSIPLSHTTSGTNRLMLVAVSMTKESGGVPTVLGSSNYNGDTLTFVGARSTSDVKGRIEIWRLIAPDTGTNNLTINLSAVPDGAVVGVMTFTGVNQTTPLGAFNSATADSSTASVNIASAVDDIVFAALVVEQSGNGALNWVGAGTERWDLYQAPAANAAGGTRTATGSSENISWTFSADKWAVGGAAIKKATGCSGGAVGTAVAEISPNNVTTSSTGNAFAYDIQATITSSNTGVNRVAITVPATFTMGTVSDVLVNGVSVSFTNNTSGNNISVDLATKVTWSARFTVLFTADAPTSQDLTGKNFTSTVDDSGTADAPLAATEGNGDGDAGDLNDWTVTTTNAAGAACDVNPSGTYIEAEKYTSLVSGTGPGTFVFESTQAGYNGTGYLSSSGGSSTEPPENMRADYTVNFTTTGTYYVWIRGYALDGNSDSVFIGLDGTSVGSLTEMGSNNQWIWTNSVQTGVNTINVATAGWHTINLWVREANHKVDGIYITQNSGAIPGGTSIGIPAGGSSSSNFTKRVIASTDDSEQRVASPFDIDLTSTDLELHNSGGDGYVGMRWTGVTIPQGATIDSAKIQFHVDEIEAASATALTVTFRGQAIDNAPAFTSTASDISNRTETTASVNWAIPTWVNLDDEGAAQLSAELKTIVQEIVNRSGWSSGNALVIMIKAWSGSGARTAESYNGESPAAPQLRIDYTVPSGTATIIDPSACGGSAGVSHFAISHDGTGINCQAENVTISAHNASHVVETTFAGTVKISTSTNHGDWSLVTGSGSLTNGGKGNAVYGFSTADNGVVTLGLRDTFIETTNINVSSQGMVEHVTEDPSLVFARSGFNFLANSAKNTIGVQIAGKPSNVAPGAQTLELQAVKTNDDTGACEAALVGANTIDIGFECEDPDTCAIGSLTFNGIGVPANDNDAVPIYARVSMDFGTAADNTATFTMQYDDVGKIRLYARSRILPSGEEMLGGSNSFVVRPFAFDMVVSGNPAATGPSGTVFVSAGTEFTAAVTALLWEAGDDLNNDGIADNHGDTDPSNNADLTNNAAAPNYGKEYAVEQVLLTAALDQPAGGANPGLSGGTSVTVFNSGSGTTTTVRYDEVGIIEMAAQVADNDYLGIGAAETQKITSKSGYVGRFNPAQYAVTASDINPACSATFTYARQPFTGSMTIEAQNGAAGGNTRTENFRGGFVTLDPASELTFVNSQTATSYNSKTVTYNQNFDSGNFGEAILALQFRWDMPEQAPATSIVRNTAVTDEVTTLAGAPVSIGSTPVRHGRAFVGTAAGSELVDLGVVMRTEYYLSSASGYVVNAEDFCSTNAVLSFSNFADNLSLGETCVQDSGSPGLSGAGCTVAGPVLERYDDPLIAGNANLWLRAPGAGNDGSANLNADVPAWLEFDWNTGVPGLEDPSGYIVFGIYGGDKNQVYRRELY